MKTLVIPDIHNEWEPAYQAMEKYPSARTIFLGDYFDSFYDDLDMAYQSAVNVKELLDAGYELCLGNHDMSYMFPYTCRCSGFSVEKHDVIMSVLSIDDFLKMKSFVYVDGFLLSHAGIIAEIFGSYNDNYEWDIELDHIEKYCNEGLMSLQAGSIHPAFQAGQDRGGIYKYGGITWCDWNSLVPIWNAEGHKIPQIVGHTRGNIPRYNKHNLCLETKDFYVGIIENRKITTQQII